jgi:hypothetical protein
MQFRQKKLFTKLRKKIYLVSEKLTDTSIKRLQMMVHRS